MTDAPFPGRFLLLLGLALLGGCSNAVHVRLDPLDCDEQWIIDVMSVYVELTRVDNTTSFHIPCKNTRGLITSLSGLENYLAIDPPMDDVPASGRWNLWIVGKNVACDDTQNPPLTLLCGKEAQFDMPPDNNEIRLPVVCESRLTSPEKLQEIKAKLKDCESGISPWRGGH
jgi:hypothetical protein